MIDPNNREDLDALIMLAGADWAMRKASMETAESVAAETSRETLASIINENLGSHLEPDRDKDNIDRWHAAVKSAVKNRRAAEGAGEPASIEINMSDPNVNGHNTLGVAVSTADRQRWSDRSAAKIDVPRTAWIAPGTPAATVGYVAKNVWQRRVPAEPICQPGRSVSPLATAHVATDPHGVERVGAQGEGFASHARDLGRGPGGDQRAQSIADATPWSISQSRKPGAKAEEEKPFFKLTGVSAIARKYTANWGSRRSVSAVFLPTAPDAYTV